MIKLFPNYKEVELTEDKKVSKSDKDDKNYEWYKGVVFDPSTNEFKVIKGQFTDKKDFYEKLTKKGYIVRKAFEAKIWDWIQNNAKNTLDAYLMCSTAFSKWNNNNLLADYYVKLLNDYPEFNREKIKGNPNTRGKKEATLNEDEDFNIDLLRPDVDDDTEGRKLENLQVLGAEDITTPSNNIYVDILEKSNQVKDYVLSKENPKKIRCHIWKLALSKDEIKLISQKKILLGKLDYLVEHNSNIEEETIQAFINNKKLHLLPEEYIAEYVSAAKNHDLDKILAEYRKLKAIPNQNTLSFTNNHEYLSWNDIIEKAADSSIDTSNVKHITLAVHLDEWDNELKNTPVSADGSLAVNKNMPFICLEKLQNIVTNSSFNLYGLRNDSNDTIQFTSATMISNNFAQRYMFNKIVEPKVNDILRSGSQDKGLTKQAAKRSIAQSIYDRAKDTSMNKELDAIKAAKDYLKQTGGYKWKNNPDFMKNMEKIYSLNKAGNEIISNSTAKADDIVNSELARYDRYNSVQDVYDNNVMVKPASRMHGGDSEGAYINSIDRLRKSEIDAKIASEKLKKKLENRYAEYNQIKDYLKTHETDTKARIKAATISREINRLKKELTLTDFGYVKLTPAEELKVQKALNAMKNNTPVRTKSLRNFNSDKVFSDYIKNFNKDKNESYTKSDFKKLFENSITLPDNYNATVMYANEPTIKPNNCAAVPIMGTIKETDNADGITIEAHDKLNEKLFDTTSNTLKPEVLEALLQVAKDFQDTLEFGPELKDVYFTGSCANYNYNDASDIDIHLVFDYENAGLNAEMLNEYYKLKKKIYNDEHNIKIKGFPVEVGVENINTPLITSGIYSLKTNEWVKEPSKNTFKNASANLGDFEQTVNYIERAINTQEPEQILRLWKEISKSRREALANGGETAPWNIIFKKLRAEGYLQRLRDAYYQYSSENLSLEALEEIK